MAGGRDEEEKEGIKGQKTSMWKKGQREGKKEEKEEERAMHDTTQHEKRGEEIRREERVGRCEG